MSTICNVVTQNINIIIIMKIFNRLPIEQENILSPAFLSLNNLGCMEDKIISNYGLICGSQQCKCIR